VNPFQPEMKYELLTPVEPETHSRKKAHAADKGGEKGGRGHPFFGLFGGKGGKARHLSNKQGKKVFRTKKGDHSSFLSRGIRGIGREKKKIRKGKKKKKKKKRPRNGKKKGRRKRGGGREREKAPCFPRLWVDWGGGGRERVKIVEGGKRERRGY